VSGNATAAATGPVGARLAPWRARWHALGLRERRLVLLAAAVLGTYLVWLLAWQPACHTARTAPAQIAALDAQLQQMQALAAEADVLIDNFRHGALERIGISYDKLAARNPRLIYCSISGFGPSGPLAEERANDIFMQAFAGNMSITGEEGRGPVKAGMSVADIGAGLYGVIGILMALQARQRTGHGQRVDTSLMEGQLAMLANQITSYFSTGRAPVRRGASSQLSVPYQAFQAADDWVVVAAFTNRMWEGVCHALARRHLPSEDRRRTEDRTEGLDARCLSQEPDPPDQSACAQRSGGHAS